MPKLTNVRERVHQPFRDTLIRTAGYSASNIQDRTDLFTQAGKSDGETNLKNGSTLPSDQSMVVLALRCMTWFRASTQRLGNITLADGVTTILAVNGDWAMPAAAAAPAFGAALNGQAVGNYRDVHRLYWQSAESLLWSFGAGDKFSITSMPSAYFAFGGGLHGDLGGVTDLIHWTNGMPSHEAILRLARAVLIPPRQNIKCAAQIVSYPDGGNGQLFGATQGTRNMLNLTANLNAVDLVNKVINFVFDGLFSRDVQ